MRIWVLLIAVFVVSLSAGSSCSNATEKPNYLISAFAAGNATADLPRVSLLEDRTNQLLLKACTDGATLNALARLGIDSLQQRLDRMCEGNVLRCKDTVYLPMLTFFTGARQVRLDSIATAFAGKMTDSVGSLSREIRSSGFVNPAQSFHVLWSLVIDACWDSIWRKLGLAESGPPMAIWIVDPPHEYQVGTNYCQLPAGSGIAATWSPRYDHSCHIDSLMGSSMDLLYAAWQMPVRNSTAASMLKRYGLVGDDGAYLGLTYRDSTPFVERLNQWGGRYADLVARSLDLKSAATALNLSESQTFVILLHQTAYALFQRLAETGDLEFPEVLKTGKPVSQTVNLVSLSLDRRPLPEDAAMALWMTNGYRGSDEIVNQMAEALAANPDNLDMRLFRGMSLYDLARYDEAASEFQELSKRTVGNPDRKRLHDWSRIWIGHVYDARGDREKALEWYRAVVNDGSLESRMSFGQYQIADIDAVSWARKRLASPFGRH